MFRETPAASVPRLLVALAFVVAGTLLLSGVGVETRTARLAVGGALLVIGIGGALHYLRVMRDPPALSLTRDVVEVRGPRTGQRLPLRHVERFVTVRARGHTFVGYLLNEDGLVAARGSHRDPSLRRLGVHGVLPSAQAYGRPPTELVLELNAALDAARRSGA
ncbi:MAG: hypothetical protein JJT89_03665 [Nitriliruptoraceae bacterium]|nr:hypothetical protein [Nitriliruptoraceae bacterium]